MLFKLFGCNSPIMSPTRPIWKTIHDIQKLSIEYIHNIQI